ncbi:MAG: hypothetical protein EBZ78_02165 [Verrucomicrobia bacterium]|nr:hypothetical protein [Verrucomicrobiota bacterium]
MKTYKVEGWEKRWRYKVVKANSPEEAIEKAKKAGVWPIDTTRIPYAGGIQEKKAIEVWDGWVLEPTPEQLAKEIMEGKV